MKMNCFAEEPLESLKDVILDKHLMLLKNAVSGLHIHFSLRLLAAAT